MATKSISQLDTQATANETDLFEVAIVDANSASGYASKKESAAAIADAIVGEYQYPLRITGTTAKTIAGAINELKNLVDLLPQFAIEVVQTLPVSDISETTIYLVPAQDPEQGNYYEEYIYVNNAWELVGTTAVDLSGYYTSAQVDTLLAAKANTSSLATVATSGAYSDLTGKPTIDTALDTTSTNAVENRVVAGAIEEIESELSSPDTSDNEPYLLRDSASGTADRMVDELVGGTIAWNQIIINGDFSNGAANWNALASVTDGVAISQSRSRYQTVYQGKNMLSGHKYFFSSNITADSSRELGFVIYNNTEAKKIAQFNVTANTFSTQEKIMDGAIGNRVGVANWSVDSTIISMTHFMCIDLTQMFGATIADYIYSLEQAEAGAGVAFFRKLFPEDYYAYNAGELISVKPTAHIMRDASDNIIGNYPLDANLELRGLFKLDANNKLYCDGDTYESSGKVIRNYEKRAYQSGDESLTDAITDGTNTVVKLATPTTETAASFAGIQIVDGDGTEEYVDSRAVPIPVGHNTTYIHGLNEYRTAVESYLASLDARITALENASSNRSLNVSQSLERSVISPIETRTEEITPEEENAVTSDSDTAESKTEETEEETKEEAQNER